MPNYNFNKRINLFEKDIFSLTKEKFLAVNNPELKKIRNLLKNNKYECIKILKLKNKLSMNSDIYLISTKKEKKILKKNLNKIKLNKKKIYLRVKFLKKNTGNLILPEKVFFVKNKMYEMSDFVEGRTYGGDLKNFKKVLKSYEKIELNTNIKKIFKSVSYFTQKEEKVLNKFCKKKTVFSDFIWSEWTRLRKLYKKKKVTKSLFHNDLHPKNVLIKKNGNVILLDHLSFKIVVPEISLSYSLLKICRQIMARSKKISKKKIIELIKLNLNKKIFLINKWDISISDLASMEALRRICIIIQNKNINLRDTIFRILIRNMFEGKKIFQNQRL
tara:strand:- start:7658 stop:8650 length:993 start_codon:yes stop_codon:yes gene_type:complete